MRPSKGVALIAGVLILFGAGAVWGIVGRAVLPSGVETLARGFEQKTARQDIPPEKIAQEREALRKWLGGIVARFDQPVAPVAWPVNAGIALAGLAAGIGLLRLKPWAWALARWQAGLSILVAGWLIVRLSAPQAPSEAAAVPAVLWSEEELRRMQVFARQIAISMLALGAAWNLFVLWFLRRPSVKAQFIRRHAST